MGDQITQMLKTESLNLKHGSIIILKLNLQNVYI